MSIPFSPEQLACIRDDARHLAAQAMDHERDLEALVRAAECDIGNAKLMSSNEATTDELERLCAAQASRVETVEAARRACVNAREQQVTARRLLSRVNDEESVESQVGSLGIAVLVVDDAEDVRDLVAYVLRDAGFVVRTATNGLEALIAAYEMQPAVIVMDMTMPVLNGIEATRLIKATKSIDHARVIAYTANTSSLPEILIQKYFVAVLPKPSTPDVVLAAVQNVAAV